MIKRNPIKILITGCGAPGISGTVHSLKNNPNNDKVFIVGTDTNKEAVGKFFCDRFEIISSFKNEEDYLNDIQRIVRKHSINVILPQNTLELPILSKKKKYFSDMGASIVISDYKAISNANNKFKLMKVAEKIKYAIKKFRLGSRTIFTKISSTRIINGIKSGIINNAFKELLRFIEIALPKLKKKCNVLNIKR